MSWLYSRALVEAYSEANFSGGEPSAQLSETHTPQAYLSPVRMTEFSRLSRFGMTFAPLTERLGADVLTSFLADFPVRTSAPQDGARESMGNEADFGLKWRESFAKWDRASCSWKTPQCSLLAGLDEFSETWPRWGAMRAGVCWALTTSERHTSATAFGLSEPWPTPRSCSAMAATITPESAHAINRFPNLETIVGRRTWTTPTAHNAKEQDSPTEALRNTPSLCHLARGGDMTQPRHLNPEWVEWLMGWPLGWTDLNPLAMVRFRQWLNSHGKP
jgi:hypothetical protein